MRKNPIMNHFVEIMKEMNDNPNIDFIRFIFKLMNKHFELDEVLIDFSLNLLMNAFSAFKNVDFVMSDQVLFLENFEKYFEKEECDKSNHSKTSLLYHRNLDEFHVFLNAEYPSDNDGD